MTSTDIPADYSNETLIVEWKRGRPGTYTGRDGWQVVKLRGVTTSYPWVIVRPDGVQVPDRHDRPTGYRSSIAAKLAAGPLIGEAATTTS